MQSIRTVWLSLPLLLSGCPGEPSATTDSDPTTSSTSPSTSASPVPTDPTTTTSTTTSTSTTTDTPTTTETPTTGTTATSTTEASTTTGVVPACMNGALDGDESDVDCGGITCPKCHNGQSCAGPDDCAGMSCIDGTCAECLADGDCPAAEACAASACDGATWTCTATPLDDGAACDDGLLCTPATGACEAGECVGGGSIAPISLAEIPAGAGFVIDGEMAGLRIGYVARGAGDVNGDGLADVILGMSQPFDIEGDEGRIYVVFGKGDSDPVPLTQVAAGQGGFIIRPEPGLWVSYYVNPAGDVNDDGRADLLVSTVSAPDLAGQKFGTGRVYVVFGKADTAPVLLADILAGNGGFALVGESEAYFGNAIGPAGDVDGDGRDDVLIGEPLYPKPQHIGRVLVAFGGDAQPVRKASEVVAAQGGYWLMGEQLEEVVGSGELAGAGDIDGDGLADLLIGAHAYDGPDVNSGRLYVVRGKADSETVELADVAAGSGGYVIDGAGFHELLGREVADLGDVDDDGIRDILVGAPFHYVDAVEAGRAYVVHGKLDGAPVAVADLEAGIGGFAVRSDVVGDSFAYSLGVLGDLDGDGRSDFVLGAYWTPYTALFAGRAHVVYTPANPETITADALAAGIGGFVLDGAAQGDSAYEVDGAGDVNGDGVPDLLIGASGADTNGNNSGRAYVLFGPLCAP